MTNWGGTFQIAIDQGLLAVPPVCEAAFKKMCALIGCARLCACVSVRVYVTLCCSVFVHTCQWGRAHASACVGVRAVLHGMLVICVCVRDSRVPASVE